jgi:hypothetical protein
MPGINPVLTAAMKKIATTPSTMVAAPSLLVPKK